MLDMRFHPDVEQEVDSAYAWYETQVTGLGEDFLHELENGLASVQTMPETWTVVAPPDFAATCCKNFLTALFTKSFPTPFWSWR